MVDNYEIIKPLLTFESKDDFYYLQILQRKKENLELGSNSRVVKNYYISSIQYLEDTYSEIKQLCDIFNARAMLRLNKRSYSKVAFKTMVNVANTMSNGEYKFISKCYDRACGETHNDSNKKWILDFDELFGSTPEDVLRCNKLMIDIYDCQPVGDKIIEAIPSKNGIHWITSPFNVKEFRDLGHTVEIHKDNPTNLYIPND